MRNTTVHLFKLAEETPSSFPNLISPFLGEYHPLQTFYLQKFHILLSELKLEIFLHLLKEHSLFCLICKIACTQTDTQAK